MKKKILENLNFADNIYLKNTEKIWTYNELKKFIFSASFFLRKKSCKKILIISEQNFLCYALILASYLSGVVYCCLKADSSNEYIDEIMVEFAPDYIYKKSEFISSNGKKINDEKYNFEEILDKFKTDEMILNNNDIIYALYTSGSTGKPKGVFIKTKAVEKLIIWATKEFEITQCDVLSQYAPLHFDMSVLDLYASAYAGCALVPFSSYNEKLFPGKYISRFGITIWNSVPQIIAVLEKGDSLNAECLETLRLVKFGGDKLYINEFMKINEVLPKAKYIITYGPTEGTVFCMYAYIDGSLVEKGYTIAPLGKNLPWCDYYLLEKEDNLFEIVLTGENIAHSYISSHISSLNCKASKCASDRIVKYYTGDLVSKTDELIFFVGREDSQIKINGNRFNLNEIKNCLYASGYTEIVVMHNDGIIELFYLDSYDLNKIIFTLQQRIPFYARPKVFTKIKNIPYNTNGKIDFEKLRKRQ